MKLDLLRPWQHAPAQRLLEILRQYGSACDMSDTGTGKTYVAVAVAQALQLPTLIVVPKISITAWHRVAAIFGEQLSVINYEKLRTGHTPFGRWEKQDDIDSGRQVFFQCSRCQQKLSVDDDSRCYADPSGIHCVETKRKPVKYGKWTWAPETKAIIFDEAHRCGGIDSLNAELMIAAKRQRIPTLALSATLACNPLKLRALGYLLDLHNDKHDGFPFGMGATIRPAGEYHERYSNRTRVRNFFAWSSGYGCKRHPAFRGWHWMVGAEKQKEVMANIRANIIPDRGVRVTTAEIPDFPKRQITAELYDIEEPSKIERLYEEMANALAVLDAARSTDISPEHPLTQFLRARQRVELLKVPIAVELATDALEKGLSVGIFVNFSQTIDELSKRLKCSDIIDGRSANIVRRQEVIDRQQRDEIRLVLLNSEAGGIAVNLQDIRGEFPRVGFVFPGFSATTFKQLCGRFHRDGGLSTCYYRVLLAAGTVEMQVHRNLRNKLDNLDALNDADLQPDNLKL